MYKNLARKWLVLPAVAIIASGAAGPVAAQDWYDRAYAYPTNTNYTYVNPGYAYDSYYANPNYTSYPNYTYVNPGYVYDNDYRYRRPISPVLKGAAIGGAAGFGLSFLGRRHHRHVVRNTAIGAGIGAGIGLLGSWF